MSIDFDKTLRPSKHFRNTWMRAWDWDIYELRKTLKEAYEIDKVGKQKYEIYTRHGAGGKSRKLIIVDYPDEIFIITGTEGK